MIIAWLSMCPCRQCLTNRMRPLPPLSNTARSLPCSSIHWHLPFGVCSPSLAILGRYVPTHCLHTAKVHSHTPHLLPSPPPCCCCRHYHCLCSTLFCPALMLATFGRCIYVQTCPRLAFLSTTIMLSSLSPPLLLVFCSILPSTNTCRFW